MEKVSLKKKYFALIVGEEADFVSDQNATFVWGYLMEPDFIKELLGRKKPFAPAVLRGYKREKSEDKLTLIPDASSCVLGVVLLNLSEEEMKKLDEFEKVPEVMIRKRIEVEIGDFRREVYIYMRRE